MHTSMTGAVTVTPGVSAGPVETIIVPVVGPVSGPPNLVAAVTGSGGALSPLWIPISMPVGRTIRAIRARVNDGGNGTRAEVDLLSSSDSRGLVLVASSLRSTGGGADETIEASGLSIQTAMHTQYYLEVLNAAGPLAATTLVFRAELDVN
jgi:hypothetical protein